MKKYLIATIALLAAGTLWWMSQPPTQRNSPTAAPGNSPGHRPPTSPRWQPSPPAAVLLGQNATGWQTICNQLTTGAGGEESRRLLTELRRTLDALPPAEASRAVRAFLLGNLDAATKLDVTVKAGGTLGDASSLRVFLLDYLGQIDRPAAAALGREILSRPTSPDEWAISLRNVAWGGETAETQAFLRGKAGEMLANLAWRQHPSAGYLEAFDVIVHTHGVELAPQLTELIRDHENRAVAHAAYLTLDRLILSDPAATLGQLAAQPSLMEGREQTRANYFARGDVRDAAQRASLEKYLLDPARSPVELQTFAGLYPSANYMISNNLLTSTVTPTQPELAERDRAALQAVEEWSSEPRFTKVLPQLSAIHARLQVFVKQASPP